MSYLEIVTANEWGSSGFVARNLKMAFPWDPAIKTVLHMDSIVDLDTHE